MSSLSNSPKRASDDDVRRVLKAAMTAGVPWLDVDLVKDHIAALEAAIAQDDAEAIRLQKECMTAGERIAGLEQHISELEKSLENARKERDEAQSSLRHLERSLMRIGERLGLATVTEPDIMAALARLKPSGQVAEDVRKAEFCPGPQGRAALSRLAAKAQAYETERPQWQETGILLDSRRKAAEEVARQRTEERDAAVADNAALLKALREHGRTTRCPRCFGIGSRTCSECDGGDVAPHVVEVAEVLKQPRPGAALLERMKRLEEALGYFMLGQCICLAGAVSDEHTGKCAEYKALLKGH